MVLRALRTLVGAAGSYAKLAVWGLAPPRGERGSDRTVLQAVIISEAGILLAIRADLRGWELPGGHLEAGESPEQALIREVHEETGARVAIEHHVGDYVRTGFLPHRAKVYHCRYIDGALRPNLETRGIRWFAREELPDTLLPWYREPIEDALCDLAEPVDRAERLGLAAIWAGMRIDLRMRFSDDRAA